VKAQGLEGLVAKRSDSRYEPGMRSGAWQKMCVNQGQEFVIGGYTHGTKTFDALRGPGRLGSLAGVYGSNGFADDAGVGARVVVCVGVGVADR